MGAENASQWPETSCSVDAPLGVSVPRCVTSDRLEKGVTQERNNPGQMRYRPSDANSSSPQLPSGTRKSLCTSVPSHEAPYLPLQLPLPPDLPSYTAVPKETLVSYARTLGPS